MITHNHSEWFKQTWFLVIIIALLYFIFGRLGFIVAIPPGNVSPVWIPAGVAFLSMILFGKKVWPGIWIGSFFVNLSFYYYDPHLESLNFKIFITFFIAFGPVLQSLFGVYLHRQLGSSDGRLTTPKDILVFSFVTAPLSCMASAVWGTAVLVLSGAITFHNTMFTWLTWLIGDWSGVVVLSSLGIIGKIDQQTFVKKSSKFFFKTVLTLLLSISIALVGSWQTAIKIQESKKVLIGICRWEDNILYAKNIAGFKAGLSKNGFHEGKNVEFFSETPKANKEAVSEIIARFLKKNVDLIFVQTTPATLKAKNFAKQTPIVFSIVTFPVETRVIKSLEQSGNNLVGTRNYIPMERQLKIFKTLVPNVHAVAFVHRKNEPNSTYQYHELLSLKDQFHIDIVEIALSSAEEAIPLLEQQRKKFNAVYSACDTLIQTGGEEKVISFVKKYGIPDFACQISGVKKGSLVGNVADFGQIGEDAGEMAAKILKGQKVNNIQTLSPNDDNIIFNIKRAEELSIKIPASFLEKSNEVVR